MNRRRFLALGAVAAVTAGLGQFVGEGEPRAIFYYTDELLLDAVYAEQLQAELERRFAVIYARELDRYLMEGDRTVPPPRGFLAATGAVSCSGAVS